MTPTVPNGWTLRGDIPEFEPTESIGENTQDKLDEDLLQILDASRAFTLDVGWYPSANVQGKFLARAILDNRWDDPVEEFESRSAIAVVQWLQGWISEILVRIGMQDVITEDRITATPVRDLAAQDLGFSSSLSELVKANTPWSAHKVRPLHEQESVN